MSRKNRSKRKFSLQLGQHADETTASLKVDAGLDRSYIDHLAATLPGGLKGLHIVADCANGSASSLAPELFERLGAQVDAIHCCSRTAATST